MRAEVAPPPNLASPNVRRWHALVMLGRTLLVSTAVVVGYFVLPMTTQPATDDVVELVLGLFLVAVLLAWQVRGVLRSPYPTLRALSALLVSLPLFLVLFATTYYLMGLAVAGSFSESMTRLDSAYFTVTTFATVGFGDITAVSETARAVTTVQMLADLVLVGLVARVIVGAVQEARSRQHPDAAG